MKKYIVLLFLLLSVPLSAGQRYVDVHLAWDDDEIVDGFTVERKHGTEPWGAIGSCDTLDFHDIYAVRNQVYEYRVLAFRGDLYSVPSKSISVRAQ